METDLRASLVAAAAAAALSALIGAIAGVAFLTLVLRALGGGLAIGAAVYGGAALLRRLVPGILDRGEAEDEGSDEPFKGSRVDIVLPGEDAAPAAFSAEDEPARDYGRERPPSEELFRQGGSEPEGDEDATELAPVDEASLLEAEGSEAEAPAAIPAAAGRERRPSAGFDELDTLPDLDGFSDTFTASEFGSGGSSPAGPAKGYSGQGGSGSRQGQEGLDPASLAQAVRTILKRDQKG